VTAVIRAASLSCWKSAKIRATLGLIRGTPDKINGQQTAIPQCDRAGGVMLARFALVLSAATMTSPAIASDPVFLHAAGSLRGALTEVAGAFEAPSGQTRAGPNTVLPALIEGRDRGRCAP
jgi:hypothetical protein